MIAAALAFSLFGLVHAPDVQVRHFNVPSWSITVAHDRISGETHCVMSGRGLKVYDDTVVVDLGRYADTSRAYFTAAGQAPEPARYAWPRNLPGRLVDRTPMENPSNGLIALPLAPVLGDERLAVQQNLAMRPRRFDLKGLKAAHQAAVAAGCPA